MAKEAKEEKKVKGLKPNTERTPEELAANGRKGGLRSVEVRRKKKEVRALLSDFLSTPVKIGKEIPEEIVEALKAAGYKDITLKERGALLLAYRMSLGDIRASLLVSKMIGEYTEELSAADMEADDTPQPIVITVADEAEAADMEDTFNGRAVS